MDNPQAISLIADHLPKGRNVRKLVKSLPNSYASYILMRKPPPRSKSAKASFYRTLRKSRDVRFENIYNKKHALNSILPSAYKNRNWKYYSIATATNASGREHIFPIFFNSKNGQPFMIRSNTGARKPLRRPIEQNLDKFYRNKRNTSENYERRLAKYARLIKGSVTRENLVSAIKNTLHRSDPNAYTRKPKEGFNRGKWVRTGSMEGRPIQTWIRTGLLERNPNGSKTYRWSNRALLYFMLRNRNNLYQKIPGYGITPISSPKKMTRRNIRTYLYNYHI
jgi:hypothetical protein